MSEKSAASKAPSREPPAPAWVWGMLLGVGLFLTISLGACLWMFLMFSALEKGMNDEVLFGERARACIEGQVAVPDDALGFMYSSGSSFGGSHDARFSFTSKGGGRQVVEAFMECSIEDFEEIEPGNDEEAQRRLRDVFRHGVAIKRSRMRFKQEADQFHASGKFAALDLETGRVYLYWWKG